MSVQTSPVGVTRTGAAGVTESPGGPARLLLRLLLSAVGLLCLPQENAARVPPLLRALWVLVPGVRVRGIVVSVSPVSPAALRVRGRSSGQRPRDRGARSPLKRRCRRHSAAALGWAAARLRRGRPRGVAAMLRARWVLPLAVGAGLGAALARWERREHRERGDAAEGLLARLPVLPAVAAASLPAPPGSVRTELSKYGLPGLAQLRSRESYVLCYDPRSRSALWVIEQLNRDTLSGASDRAACDFQEDDSVHEYHRATNADYRGSGFDRGHLAAAANHRWSQKAMRDTFYLSNIAPQNPHLNQNAWNNLEKYCRSLAKNNRNVYVCTGPLFLPRMEADGKMYVKYQVIGKNNVAVPTHFFKVLILEKESGEIELRSYVMPNSPVDDKIPLERFLVPIESIERASGLLFVPNILRRTSNLKAITAGKQ
ncbi:endonuclease G, mitochondrial [Ammospiza nelsoni]|uniref:endonuclease G, mitochondrial n=2 Tax=Passeriformes TaxID=9126 RepID=UPI002869AF2C|nr:endonuclease G, mitochondrial [Ammospiza nelsoni]